MLQKASTFIIWIFVLSELQQNQLTLNWQTQSPYLKVVLEYNVHRQLENTRRGWLFYIHLIWEKFMFCQTNLF